MVYQTIAKVREVAHMIKALGFEGEFTKKQFDGARAKGSTSLEWLTHHGITPKGTFCYRLKNNKSFRPIVKLVRQEFFTITLKEPIKKEVVMTADGKEIPNVKAEDAYRNPTVVALLKQIFPNFKIETVETTEIEVCRNYYEIDYDVVAVMTEFANDEIPYVVNYYNSKIEEAQRNIARYERIISCL